jgi:hypothetical protein
LSYTLSTDQQPFIGALANRWTSGLTPIMTVRDSKLAAFPQEANSPPTKAPARAHENHCRQSLLEPPIPAMPARSACSVPVCHTSAKLRPNGTST